MLRKTVIALLVVASAGLVLPTVASARGGGGFHGEDGIHDHGNYHYYGYPYVYYPNGYGDSYDTSDGCNVVRRGMHTAYGPRQHPAQVCG
jgi:hypothetical protein